MTPQEKIKSLRKYHETSRQLKPYEVATEVRNDDDCTVLVLTACDLYKGLIDTHTLTFGNPTVWVHFMETKSMTPQVRVGTWAEFQEYWESFT